MKAAKAGASPWRDETISSKLEVNMRFPSRRELAPAVRAFVDFMKETNQPGFHWQDNELPGTV